MRVMNGEQKFQAYSVKRPELKEVETRLFRQSTTELFVSLMQTHLQRTMT